MPIHHTLIHADHTDSTVHVGAGVLRSCAAEVAGWLDGRTVFLVTSAPVEAAIGAGRLDSLLQPAREVVRLEVPDGERAKTVQIAAGLWQEMLRRGGKRDSRLVAFGGGTVGDLGGFVAGCFLRGIGFLQVPTTLLAQVDASVGGKTGVDLVGGKNSVGVFHHPAHVLADAEVLRSLPTVELRAGLAEVIKMAALLNPDLLRTVEESLNALLAGDSQALSAVVAGSVEAKSAIVRQDAREAGPRRLLNFGHTLAHALEAASDYSGLRHGEAVAYGVLFALRLSCARGLDRQPAERIRAVIRRLGLPALPQVSPQRLIELMGKDKKAREDGLDWVLMEALGRGSMVNERHLPSIAGELEAFLADPLNDGT